MRTHAHARTVSPQAIQLVCTQKRSFKQSFTHHLLELNQQGLSPAVCVFWEVVGSVYMCMCPNLTVLCVVGMIFVLNPLLDYFSRHYFYSAVILNILQTHFKNYFAIKYLKAIASSRCLNTILSLYQHDPTYSSTFQQ